MHLASPWSNPRVQSQVFRFIIYPFFLGWPAFKTVCLYIKEAATLKTYERVASRQTLACIFYRGPYRRVPPRVEHYARFLLAITSSYPFLFITVPTSTILFLFSHLITLLLVLPTLPLHIIVPGFLVLLSIPHPHTSSIPFLGSFLWIHSPIQPNSFPKTRICFSPSLSFALLISQLKSGC